MGKTERNKIIDISKGIALLLVIFGHLKWEEGLAFFYSCRFYYGFMRFIYSFHIIIFFIFIGFLYSEKTIKSKNNLSAVKNIFATYIIFLIIYFVNFLIFNYHSKDIELIFVDLLYAVFFSNSFYLNKLGIHGFLWFLPAYCFSILIYVYSKKIKNNFIKIFLLAILFPYLGYYMAQFVLPQNIPWGINIALILCPFVLVGSYYKTIEKIIFYIVNRNFYIKYLLIMLIFFILAFNNNFFALYSSEIPNFFYFYLFGFLGFIFLILWAVVLLDKKLGEAFCFIGKNSLSIYLFHIFIIEYAWLFRTIYYQSYWTLLTAQILIICLSIILPPYLFKKASKKMALLKKNS